MASKAIEKAIDEWVESCPVPSHKTVSDRRDLNRNLRGKGKERRGRGNGK